LIESVYRSVCDHLQLLQCLGAGATAFKHQPRAGERRPQVMRGRGEELVAGALELALPLGVALTLYKFRQRTWMELALAASLTLTIGFSLLMTTSRGAWLALGVVGIGAVLFYVGQKILARTENPSRLALPLTFNLLILGVLVLINFSDLIKLVDSLGAVTASGRSISRLELYSQAAHLIQDYDLIGSGLGVFSMIFSTYALLIDVPFLPHAHNLFMQVWIEQGLLGFVAFIWTIVAFYLWVWKRLHRVNWLAAGALAATTVMLLHSSIDVVLYSSRFLPLMFMPMALTVASLRRARSTAPLFVLPNLRMVGALAGLGALALALLFIFVREPLSAEWLANLGSVAETRVELAHYHFADALVEFVRRDADLSAADSYFRQALAADPENVTANQRLAQIALARGQYDDALHHLVAAEARDPQNELTWELLGEAYLGAGKVDEAYAYWSRINDAAPRLRRLARVRFERNGDTAHAKLALALADRGYVLDTGHITASGPAADLLNNPRIRSAYLGL